ncbi:hypothetical protein ONZ45_g17583 [Pleurotus djamor]|nr:hypothetical protein ONZ45_g17583 [Pleurotus djamor]
MAFDLEVLVKQLDILRKRDDGRLRVLIETRTSEVQAQFGKVASLLKEGDREAVSQMVILEEWLSLLGAITTHLGAGTMEDLFPGIGEMVLDWESKASLISERIKVLENNGAAPQDDADNDERSDSDADEEARNEAELAVVARGGHPCSPPIRHEHPQRRGCKT